MAAWPSTALTGIVGLSDEELIDLGVLAQEVSGQRDKERKREMKGKETKREIEK